MRMRIKVGDVDGDDRVDLITTGKQGTFLLLGKEGGFKTSNMDLSSTVYGTGDDKGKLTSLLGDFNADGHSVSHSCAVTCAEMTVPCPR